MTLKDFISQLNLDVSMARENGSVHFDANDFLSSVILDYLDDMGEITDPIIAPFRSRGLQMSGYSISEEHDCVDIFVSQYFDDENPTTVPGQEVDAALRRAMQIFRKAKADLYKDFEHDNDAYEFARTLHDYKDLITNVRILFLTNGIIKPVKLSKIEADGVEYSFDIWDVGRLFKVIESGKQRESIKIDFISQFGQAIECIENSSCTDYRVFLALLPGSILADIYEEHGPRLLERNVRSFLHLKGAVNTGIHTTLRDFPHMFLAYNNGISVTAEKVEIIRDANGKPSIASILDIQIVNGGQTTASIHNARRSNQFRADLTNVYVQMKVAEISDMEKMDEIVPKISFFSNTQNKIQLADFSANDPYHRKIEEYSRTIWTPSSGGNKSVQWFYERARGQYADMMAQARTASQKKKYKEEHPLFTKTDLAKYENSWQQLPYYVSEGAQKSFKRFAAWLSDGNMVPLNVHYYEKLIAKAILFRETEKLIDSKHYGGYRANIVTYTISLLSNRTAQRIDLSRIWKEQCLSPVLSREIINASEFVWEVIINPPGNGNIGEWCKNKKCWDKIKLCDFQVSSELANELISVASTSQYSGGSQDGPTGNEQEIIDHAASIPAEKWFALSRWSKETGNLTPWQRSLVFSIGTYVNRKKSLSIKQARQAIRAMSEATEKGFQLS